MIATVGRLRLVPGRCCVCDASEADPIATGEDFEYRTSADSFLAVRCRDCELVYLDPRPAGSEFERIYPSTYHAFAFDEAVNRVVRVVRERLETARLTRWIGSRDASVLDVGCGDGFHLALLHRRDPHRRVAGIDTNAAAAARARSRGLDVRSERLEDARDDRPFDVALLIQTIEHLEDPASVLRAVRERLVPGGRLIIVTDNTRSLDRTAFAGRHWGGYHFPRHLSLFNRDNLARLAAACGYDTKSIRTIASPVNWVYSIRNVLVDFGAPPWLYERFSLSSVAALGAFTIVDAVAVRFGRGALLHAELVRA